MNYLHEGKHGQSLSIEPLDISAAANVRGRQMQRVRNHALVIDIDEDFLIAMERRLEDLGFDTTITWDVREALNLLACKQFEVVLIGHHPPDVNASDILLYRGARKSPSYFVLVPASRISPECRFFLSQGAKEVLCKSENDKVAERVRACMARREDPPVAPAAGSRAS